ncbi:HIG1 domain-containing protein [Altererythrobacter sp. KTW20L]|uniref:HIG1 domain-containing protein n=1 Tax=Altererythrobacter sp. KTW20L TaxID=2942210 RepID=UPI0020C15243|nr:HIG1 domain-containing protein [Altererythrobacter sp. KTW20L]MCL6249793.1 HIG1 domain-containing protein [Altererythrobacter sp. KTW20L]
MNWFLALVVIGLAIMVLVSLVRGIVAFLQTTKLDLNNQQDMVRASEMQAKQNKMMFARIKYQALAIVVVAILLAVNQ